MSIGWDEINDRLAEGREGDDELRDVIRRMRALWDSATPEERAERLVLIEEVLGPDPEAN